MFTNKDIEPIDLTNKKSGFLFCNSNLDRILTRNIENKLNGFSRGNRRARGFAKWFSLKKKK